MVGWERACLPSEQHTPAAHANALSQPLTSTRDAQSAARPSCAAGGAMSVPNDQSATPAMSTLAPPILHSSEEDVLLFIDNNFRSNRSINVAAW